MYAIRNNIYMNVTKSNEKETMSFSGIKEKYMGRFQGRKEKGERK